MSDIDDYDPDDVQRGVATEDLHGHEATAVSLRRELPAPPAEVWAAIATPERLSGWFLPVEGELRVGGRYQLQGNAGGEVLECDPPRLARVTWEFGEQPEGTPRGEVVVRLAEGGSGGTLLELAHTAVVDPDFWAQYGPGATGVGWDLALLGLTLHLASGGAGRGEFDEEAFAASDEGADLIERSSAAWARAAIEFGTSPEDAVSAGGRTTAFYTGRPDPGTAPASD